MDRDRGMDWDRDRDKDMDKHRDRDTDTDRNMDTDKDMDMDRDTDPESDMVMSPSSQLKNQRRSQFRHCFPRKTALRRYLNTVHLLYGATLYHTATLRYNLIPLVGIMKQKTPYLYQLQTPGFFCWKKHIRIPIHPRGGGKALPVR
jgi:hypothetical protein